MQIIHMNLSTKADRSAMTLVGILAMLGLISLGYAAFILVQ